MGLMRENMAHMPPRRSEVQGLTDTTEGLFFSVRHPERHIRGSALWVAFCTRLCPRSVFTAQSRNTVVRSKRAHPWLCSSLASLTKAPLMECKIWDTKWIG
ncbi:hypothetical protein ATANTOWER_026992 [Ataeniobius toweri]|uniref:Uncharacterized protein n=1 Tax=Ataeniobius toweri TaxID=208326 RepID=A0ABU7C3Y6_9TELE|nr:hypothetical protein [Ataeniobius toweri]